jgi:hypothetical protein
MKEEESVFRQGTEEKKSQTTLWERKGNLTSDPSSNPIPPKANIGGSASGKVADSSTSTTTSNTSGGTDQTNQNS